MRAAKAVGTIRPIMIVAMAGLIGAANAATTTNILQNALGNLIQAQQKAAHQNPQSGASVRDAAGAAAVLPSTSTAFPDIVGIKVGQSSIADTRAALKKVTPALEFEETEGQLIGQSASNAGMPRNFDIPNSKYLKLLQGTTAGHASGCDTRYAARITTGNCEFIDVEFSGPPDAGTVLYVRRIIGFAQGPSLTNTAQSLIAKYGTPGYVNNYHGYGTEYTFAWAWNATGNPVPLSEQHPCAAATLSVLRDLNFRESDANAALRAGCAAIVQATINVTNGTVNTLQVRAIDQFHVLATVQKTRAYISSAVANALQQERDKAAAVGVPHL